MGDTQSIAGQVMSVVTALLGFGVVIVLAYISTKYISDKFSLKSNKSKNIKIIERVPLAQDKSLIIVQSAGKTMMLGVTSQHIEFISELDENLISEDTENDLKGQDFYTILKDNLGKMTNLRKDKKDTVRENTDEEKHD